MRLGRTALWILLQKNVVELRFHRRIFKQGFKDYRRMLCTTDKALLMSVPGQKVLNFVPPTGSLKYDPASKNLIVAWDIFMQNFRMINCDDVEVVAVIQTSPDQTEFWNYFTQRLSKMSTDHKAQFMNT